MMCPKCRHDVGSQSVCPYCGATVYLQNSGYRSDNQVHIPHRIGHQTSDSDSEEIKIVKNIVWKLDTKVNLLLIVSGANMLLLVLLLIALVAG